MALVPAQNGFVPSPESLKSVCEMLTISRDPTDGRHAQASAQLYELMVQAEFLIHLTYTFTRLTPTHIPDDVRQLAGLCLKQGVSRAPLRSLPTEVQSFVRAELLLALADPHSPAVRKTAGSVISTLASSNRIAGGLAAWPELVPSLFGLLDASATGAGEQGAAGALSCLSKVIMG